MKRILILTCLSMLFFLTGCTDMMNTPSKRVEEFLGKYQTMDEDVITDLDRVIDEENASDNYKTEYKALMEKQYQNLSYKIKEEETNGDDATVTVEIEVFDYQHALDKAEEYIEEHEDEFLEEKNKTRQNKIFKGYYR